MADHEEPALPPPPPAAPAAPNAAAPAPVVEPLDVPAPFSRTRGNFPSHVVNLALCGVGFAFVGSSHVCLGLPSSPVSLLFRTTSASFSFGRLVEFSRFPHVFCFFASLGFIVSWIIIMFLSFLFSVSISLLFGAIY